MYYQSNCLRIRILRGITTIILLSLIAQENARKLSDTLIDQLVEALSNRMIEVSPRDKANLDSTALGKPGHLVLSRSAQFRAAPKAPLAFFPAASALPSPLSLMPPTSSKYSHPSHFSCVAPWVVPTHTTPTLQVAAEGGGGRVSSAVKDKDVLSKTDAKKVQAAKQKLDTKPPRGTRDFYPEDMRLRTWLFDQWKQVAKSYAFSEYDAPVLESEVLYTRKAGEEVTQQLYNFVDKGDRAVALRPEMTPSLARMVMAKKGGLNLPLKWFSIPQCWRYERMTRGRRREHFQWNMDIWGVEGVEAEAELLSAMVKFFENVGLTAEDVGIKVNSRLVIGEVLSTLGIPEDKFAATCVLVDKLEKVPVDAIQGELAELGLDRAVVEKLLEVLSNNSVDSIRAVLAPDSAAVKQLDQLISLCEGYGISDWILFDASVVRGLAYYTGIVFEAFDRKGELRAIAGGGRYDKLLETFGGDSIPACGFGFGDAVIVELLKERNVLPSFQNAGIDTVVFAFDRELYKPILDIASTLRKAGQSVDVVLENKKPKWVFKHADRLGARFCIVMGSDEFARGEVNVKDLSLGDQKTVKIDEISNWANQVKS